ncbi:MAG: hypothetical protein ACM33T_07025 [Solirubrobacterales bacterium]
MALDPHQPAIREVVGTFADREHFLAAVDALVKAGFPRSELSVLSSHDSIDMVGREGKPWRDVLTGLVGEVKYEWPLVTAGIIALFAGPVGGAVAALVAAGVGGMAAKELLDEVAAIPDSGDFARALAAGSVILWVIVRDQRQEERAKAVLTAAGAANVHTFERKAEM